LVLSQSVNAVYGVDRVHVLEEQLRETELRAASLLAEEQRRSRDIIVCVCLYTSDFNQLTALLACLCFYPRDAMLAWVIGTATCPSVTCRYCVKTKKASGMISSPSGSPKTLVFWRQISSPNSRGSPERGPQTRVSRKNSAIFQL